MRRLLAASLALLACALALALAPASAHAQVTTKKAMWGPVEVDGVSQFPIYRDLGVGILQIPIRWDIVAPQRPRNPEDPGDPAYRWPPEVDYAIREGQRHGIRIAVQISFAPRWANGDRSPRHAPRRPRDFGQFARAAAERWPEVGIWEIWSEPTRTARFAPLRPETRGRPLSARQRIGPRTYARLLDVAYGALKDVRSGNLVVGGNSLVTGDVSPRNWIRFLRLPNGRRPRMDLYGHNPFTSREPDLDKPPLGFGFADFSDLDTLAGWLDRYRLRRPDGGRLRIFISEFQLPTDHSNHEFNFWLTREAQARFTRAALRITRSWWRIYTLGWMALYDEPPNRRGDEVNRGLLDWRGQRKPAYEAFKNG